MPYANQTTLEALKTERELKRLQDEINALKEQLSAITGMIPRRTER